MRLDLKTEKPTLLFTNAVVRTGVKQFAYKIQTSIRLNMVTC